MIERNLFAWGGHHAVVGDIFGRVRIGPRSERRRTRFGLSARRDGAELSGYRRRTTVIARRCGADLHACRRRAAARWSAVALELDRVLYRRHGEPRLGDF